MNARLLSFSVLLAAGTAFADQPAITADEVISIDGLRAATADESALTRTIESTPDAETYLRLGELYAARFRAAHDKTNLLKAVKVFRALADNDAFRDFEKMDIALFEYGYTLQAGKYMKEARAVYDRLLKNHPNSIYVPQAHLVFADYYFGEGELPDAEARYRQVLKFPKSNVYWYAMYKLGWIRLDLGNYQEALETFFQVAQATKADATQAAMHREATRDFVRAYVEIGKPDKAAAAFGRVDVRAAPDMLDLLVELYEARQQPDKAAMVQRAWEVPLPTDVTLAAPPRKVPVARDIPSVDQEALVALENRAANAAAAKRAHLELERAVIFRKHDHHDEVIAIASRIVQHDASSDVAELAANLWLDSLVRLHEFDRALELADALAADRQFMAGKAQLQRNIEFLRSRSLR